MATSRVLRLHPPINPNPSILLVTRTLALWSMKKDASLESTLSRNRRWIVNNQIKNMLLRCPNQVAPVRFLQKKFKSLDLQGKALNWLKKYPCCFQVYLHDHEYHFRLSKTMMHLVQQEESLQHAQQPILMERLAKLLMMTCNHRINVVKFNELKRLFGFPDDYLIRILPNYPTLFRIVNYTGKRNSMEIELVSWNPTLAVSVIENVARERNQDPKFTCSLPSSWDKSWERFNEFNGSPYISPYGNGREFLEGSKEMEKRAVGLLHELLSLTLWKKASILKLDHFRREFLLPDKLNVFLLRHPGIFYVSNKYQIYTVVLREGYNGLGLIHKDPLVVVKEKFGELMQEGLHEYNRRRHALNLEKKKKCMDLARPGKRDPKSVLEASEDHPNRGKQRDLYNPEERKRFYEVLFDEGAP